MKHTFLVIALLALLCVFSACRSKTGPSAEDAFGKDASYAIGLNIGSMLKADDIYPDLDEFTKGMKDALYDGKPRFEMEEAYQLINEASMAVTERREAKDREREAEDRQAEVDFLVGNGAKPGIVVTDSGLQYEVISEGSGPRPSHDSMVQVHYEGTFTDGTIFDSSYSNGEPVIFPLGDVIPGWTEGLQLMSVGSKYRFFIPSNLGYGPQGRRPRIPPYTTLVFEVELLGIEQDSEY
ncbi:MAG: FKBP-type peptidyl-prolyl cis-trans isomerase [Treponema sp.]|jgi:FKBP-type peptidyl-prolyl cis-trans isomerase|nr:FKBP-type peptidyl-prolyl cis-trans isomerase [Treponema sp.]